jgi:hypothetical protein
MMPWRTSEMTVNFDETTGHYMPESCHFNTRLREKLKSQTLRSVLKKYLWQQEADGTYLLAFLVLALLNIRILLPQR